MRTSIHMCADIRGMLKNNRRKNSFKGAFTDEKTGRSLSDEEARDYLYDCLAKGWRVIPMAKCDNFDYQTGCKGHEM